MTMNDLIYIASADDERTTLYKSMKNNMIDKLGNDLFVGESDKVVLKMIKHRIKLHSILAHKRFYEENEDSMFSINCKSLYYADIETLKEIIGFKMHTGVMALAYRPKLHTLQDLDDRIVMMNGIIDSENIGSIIRNSAAFGINSIIYDNKTSSPYLRRAVRVSMGTIFSIKLVKLNLIDDLFKLKEVGYKIISAELTNNATPIHSFKFPDKFILIFGSESGGIDSNLLEISDSIVYIPISHKIESLNVAASSAVILSRI